MRRELFRSRLPAIALICVFTGGCDLTGPTRYDSYELVAVNGSPLPYTFRHSRNVVDGRLLDLRWKEGTFSLFAGGRFVWNVTVDALIDGAPSPDFPPRITYRVGAYSRSASALELGPEFGAVQLANGELLLTDQTGGLEGGTFLFRRK